MKDNKINMRFGMITLFIIIAAASRFLPINNFSPLGGMALFGAAYFGKKYWALLIPFTALWLSDVILNNTVYAQFYESFQFFGDPWVYLSFGLIAALGYVALKKVEPTRLLGVSLLSSVLFFLVSNFGAWMAFYPKTFAGLTACYTAAIPFFQGTLMGDLFYVGVLFGGYELLKRYYFKDSFANV